jgi:Ca2+-binding RTX toxin-like protein
MTIPYSVIWGTSNKYIGLDSLNANGQIGNNTFCDNLKCDTVLGSDGNDWLICWSGNDKIDGDLSSFARCLTRAIFFGGDELL